MLEKATFAGGCFWCMVHPFDSLDGVERVLSGYTGGQTPHPTYEEVCSHTTGHMEAVEISFDPSVIDYRKLVDIFWHQIDPTDAGGQFADRGSSYETAIFYHNEAQRQVAEDSKAVLQVNVRRSIATKILPAGPFYPAEEYHQDFYKKNPMHYERYRFGSGRDRFLHQFWSKPE